MKTLKTLGVITALVVLILAGTLSLGLVKSRNQAQAQIENYTLGDLGRTLEFDVTEIQEIVVDQIRKLVMEQLLNKMVDKIVGGQDGGVGGGAGGTSGEGQGAFIKNYGQFIYGEAAKDTNRFIDDKYDEIMPSYMDSQIKEPIKDYFSPDFNPIPDDCVDINSIDFNSDEDQYDKIFKAIQPGCDPLTAQSILFTWASGTYSQIANTSAVEAIANKGFVKKDEQINQLQQAGSTYDAIIKANVQGLVDVQTNNQSAVSSIIGALLDQVLDQLLSKSY